jgi:hypothetical protein
MTLEDNEDLIETMHKLIRLREECFWGYAHPRGAIILTAALGHVACLWAVLHSDERMFKGSTVAQWELER